MTVSENSASFEESDPYLITAGSIVTSSSSDVNRTIKLSLGFYERNIRTFVGTFAYTKWNSSISNVGLLKLA